ncbi:MAG TPA: CCA tRNA nucleotidyltransferase [Motilibacteraceae bacterium]|nr:CCA tRNA nucleotidyltransferase [Motilibacteraceae bacterium]
MPTTPRPAPDALPAAPPREPVGERGLEAGAREDLTEAQRRAVAELPRVSPVADDLAARFAAAGHSLALVGGSVRDALLGRLGQDLDFTTDARPDQVLALVAPWADVHWETGIAFGTVAARKAGYTVEVTTYRDEAYQRDSRKPAVTFGDTLEGDLVRRDFTVNAMAVALPRREFVDPHGGLRDLAARVLRTPGTPEESFSDDPLRMLRAARFSAQLGFDVAADVVAAMTAMADRITIVSAERVRDELVKLLLSPDPVRGLRLIVDTGLADHVLPELPKLKLEIDEHHRHKDVYEHTLTVLEQAIALEPALPEGGPDLTLRLAALLHDVGKPRTRRFQPGGGVSFHNHEVVGARITEARLRELRFPKDLVADVARLVELHLRFHGYGTGEWTDSAVRRYVRDAGDLLPRLHALTRSDCTTRNRRRAAALSAAYDHLEERIARLAEEEELASLRPALDGNQIMTLLGLRPGPVVGRAYQHLMELRMDRGPMSAEEAEAALRAWWAQQPEAAEG